MTAPRVCSACQAVLPDDAPQGLCPRCLFQGAMAETDAGGDEEANGLHQQHIEELLNSRLPGYKITGLLGRGGMGEVWLADQPALKRQVAIKVLPLELSGQPGFAERFQREAQVLAGLDHPNILRLYDYGSVEGLSFFVMEYCPSSLRQVMPQWVELGTDSLVSRFKTLCQGVGFAHGKGIIHRDIKPENVLWNDRGLVLGDFGLAGLLDSEEGLAAADGSGDARLTAAGQVMGTPRYMAPEQRQPGNKVDHLADIYALGLVLHELLTGEVPAGSDEIATGRISDARLVRIITRCLAREPADRYQDIEALTGDLEKVAKSWRFAVISGDIWWASQALVLMGVIIYFLVGGTNTARYMLFFGLCAVEIREWYIPRFGQWVVRLVYAVAVLATLVGPVLGWELSGNEDWALLVVETVGAFFSVFLVYTSLLWVLVALSRSYSARHQADSGFLWVVLLFCTPALPGLLAVISIWADWTTLNTWLPFTILAIVLAGKTSHDLRRVVLAYRRRQMKQSGS